LVRLEKHRKVIQYFYNVTLTGYCYLILCVIFLRLRKKFYRTEALLTLHNNYTSATYKSRLKICTFGVN